MERIDSSSNKKIKLVVKLHTGKYRKQEGFFVAEGVRLAEMAIASTWHTEFAFVSDRVLDNPRVQQVISSLEAKSIPVYAMTDDLYNKAAATVASQGLLLVMRQGLVDIDSMVENSGNKIFAVLDGVQDPGNAGTIIRTAEAAGFDGIICLQGTVDILSDKVVRSAMGSLFNVPIVTGISQRDFIQVCKDNDIKMMVTALDRDAVNHFSADYSSRCAVIFGNEGNGVSLEIIGSSDEKIFIPMSGKAESLNVSVAAAIVIYEAYRQRNVH